MEELRQMTEQIQTQPEKTKIASFLNILEEFESLIIPLEKEEFEELEKQILKHGVREPLVSWNGYLVDGHHRYKICTKHGLKFPQVEYNFSCKEAVKSFIYKNQCGRRNISTFQKIEYTKAALEIDLRLEAKKRQIRKPISQKSVDHNCGRQNQDDEDMSGRTDRKMANLTGASHNTVHKASKIIDFGSEELKKQLREDKISIHAGYQKLKAKDAEEAGETVKFPKEDYRVFYADFFEQDCSAGWEPIKNFSDLQVIPVRKHHNNSNAVCFLWSSLVELPGTLSVLRAWGFSYETLFILENDRKFEDLYNSSDHLVVVVGAGKDGSVPDINHRLSSVLDKNMAGKHRVSEFRKLIDQMYTSGNKIQLFSNHKTPEWDVFN